MDPRRKVPLHGFLLGFVAICTISTATVEARDIYNLGNGLTKNGQPCKITYSREMRSRGSLADAVRYLDEFVVRQQFENNQEKETECFFEIDTAEYMLVSQERKIMDNSVKSDLWFKRRNNSCCPCPKYNTEYSVTLRSIGQSSHCINVAIDHHETIIPVIIFTIFLLLVFSVVLILCGEKISLKSRKFSVHSENYINILFGAESEQDRNLKKDSIMYEEAFAREENDCFVDCKNHHNQSDHLEECTITPIDECSECVSTMKLVCYHARTCGKEEGSCKIPYCDETKEEMSLCENVMSAALKSTEGQFRKMMEADFCYCDSCDKINATLHCTVCEDFDLCDSCQSNEPHCHEMVPVPSSNLGSEESDFNTIGGLESIGQCLGSLVHASKCAFRYCVRPYCQELKTVVRHIKTCKEAGNNKCEIGAQIIALIHFHARQCSVEACSVPFCGKIIKEQPEKINESDGEEVIVNMEEVQHDEEASDSSNSSFELI